MLIFNEQSKLEIIDNVYSPSLSTHFWVLDLDIDGAIDYTLAPIVMCEETICKSLKLRIQGFEFNVPDCWNILIYDEETSAIDVIEVKDLFGKAPTAFVYGPNASRPVPSKIEVVDVDPLYVHVAPALNKNQMLCHPISPTLWVNIAPTDTYNKYLKDKSVGDII